MKISKTAKVFLFFALTFNISRLEANNLSSQVDIQPMARSNHWQMLRFVFNYRKDPLWGADNCTSKINDKCKKNHSHTGSTGRFSVSNFRGPDSGPMLFDSRSACIKVANDLQSFYRQTPESHIVYHSHEVKGEGLQFYHRHTSNKLRKLDFKYFCYQSSSIDFDATELDDVWYMKSFFTEKSKYPYGWGETDCRPKKGNGNCKTNHSHSKKIYPYTDFYSHGLYFGSFDSYSQCDSAGSKINSFLRNLSINGSMQHSHSSGGNDDKAHRHTINDRYRLGLKYSCINAKGY